MSWCKKFVYLPTLVVYLKSFQKSMAVRGTKPKVQVTLEEWLDTDDWLRNNFEQ